MKDLTLFGSTYPELTSWGKLPRPQLATEVARKVRELYYPLTAAARISSAVKSAAVEPVGLFTVNTVALAPFAIGEEDQAKSTVEAVQEKAQAVLSVATTTAQEFPSVEVPTSISTAGSQSLSPPLILPDHLILLILRNSPRKSRHRLPLHPRHHPPRILCQRSRAKIRLPRYFLHPRLHRPIYFGLEISRYGSQSRWNIHCLCI